MDAPLDLHGPMLIAYDGSERSEAAIAAAGRLAPGAAAVVLTVHEPVMAGGVIAAGSGLTTGALDPEFDEAAQAAREAEATRITEAGTAAARAAGLLAEPRSERGTGSSGTWSAILAAADDVGAELIVIGARGHSGIASALLGSVCDGVVHHATIPVLVVPSAQDR
jgi:nucleotide-binding universal stress UspA family protein